MLRWPRLAPSDWSGLPSHLEPPAACLQALRSLKARGHTAGLGEVGCAPARTAMWHPGEKNQPLTLCPPPIPCASLGVWTGEGEFLSFQRACVLEMGDLGPPAVKQNDSGFTDAAGAVEGVDRKPSQKESWGSARVWQRFPGPTARSSHLWGGVGKPSYCLP